jgi:fumarate reductase subunit D
VKIVKNGFFGVVNVVLGLLFSMGLIDEEAYNKRFDGYSNFGRKLFIWSTFIIALVIFVMIIFLRRELLTRLF